VQSIGGEWRTNVLTNGSPTPYDHLLRDVSGHRKEWQRYVYLYGLLYPLIRIQEAIEETPDGDARANYVS
jgi:hypothetical protein